MGKIINGQAYRKHQKYYYKGSTQNNVILMY